MLASASVVASMSEESVKTTVGAVRIDVPGSLIGGRTSRFNLDGELISNIEGRLFVKLSKADNTSRRMLTCLIGGSMTESSFPNILPRTDVLEQLAASRYKAIMEMVDIGEINGRRKTLRLKATKIALLKKEDSVVVDGPSHGLIASQPVRVKADLRGAVWVELTDKNIVYVMSLIKSQFEAGGVMPQRVLKKQRRDGTQVEETVVEDMCGQDCCSEGSYSDGNVDDPDGEPAATNRMPEVTSQIASNHDNGAVANRLSEASQSHQSSASEPVKRTLADYFNRRA